MLMALKPARGEARESGVDQDGDKRGGQCGVVKAAFDQIEAAGGLNQNVREFSNLGKANAHEKGSDQGITEETDDERPDQELARENEQNHGREERGIGK